MKFSRKALVVILALGLSIGGSLMATASNQPVPLVDFAGDAKLSPIGERAVEDVRRCLSASDVLNVFYLIDNSGSLAGFQDGRPGTDVDYRRVDVINQSLRSLSELSAGGSSKKINFSMGFFSSSFSPAVGWTPLSKQTLPDLEQSIAAEITVAQPPSGFTHWEAGVADAHRALQAQQGVESGCQMMVWLTDGGINVNNSVPSTEQSAVNLCGTDFRGGDRVSAVPNGTFNSLRQSGVSVFAVLLDIDSQTEDWQKELMRPLVEGEGLSEGQTVKCGVNPIPSNFSAGAFIEANSVSALSTQFLKLAARISGGSDGTMISKDKISVPRGVARLQVIGVDNQAILASPTGRALMQVAENDGFIDARVIDEAEFGTWSVTATDWSPPAIVWGALVLTPDRDQKVAGGAEQEVGFTLDTESGSTISVDDYDFNLAVMMTYPDGSTETQSLPSGQLSAGGNRLVFIPNPAFSQVQIRYATENLRTREGQVPLASLVAEQNVTITPPTQFPTVSNAVLNKALIGSISPAEGEFTLNAPLDGNTGTVCVPGLSGGSFASDPQIIGDSADRLAGWDWTLALGDGAQTDGDCVVLGPGEQATLAYSASHPTSADSVVQALTEITLGDGEGGTLTISKEIVFPSERIYFASVGLAVRIVLIALGILLPFIVLYLVALLTTKAFHGRELRRAKFPVIYNNETKSLALASGASLTTGDLGKDEFVFQSPVDDFKKLTDPDLGTLTAVVSPNPLRAPWFEITPRSGNRVFTAKEPPPFFKARFDAGRKALFGGDMSRLWVLNFSETQLREATSEKPEIRGDLIVFSRDSFGTPVNMPDTMAGILSTLKASSAIKKAHEALVAESKAQAGAVTSDGGKTSPAPPPPPRRGGGSFSPPSGTSGGPPPPPPRIPGPSR